MSSLAPSTPTQRTDRTRRRTIVRWAKRVALGLIGLGIATAIVYAYLPKPVPVDLATARHSALEVEVMEDGQTRVRDRFVVSAPLAGELQRIELEPGDVVATGDPLAVIAPPEPMLLDPRSRREAAARLAGATARLRTATTAIERAKVSRDQAIREADRARRLAERGAITGTERERLELSEQLAIRDHATAEQERSAAVAEVEAARAVLAPPRADRTGRRVTVTAPSGGRILRVVRDSAGPVAAGAPLLELGDPREIEAVVDVLSSDAARIAPGMAVSIERWGGDRALTGRVRQVEPSAFTEISALGVEEQRVRVIVRIEAPPTALGDGFRVVARIIIWRGEHVLTIPASAVFRDRGRWAVYVEREGRARLQAVRVGHRGRADVEIVSGLVAGERVIVHPGDNVEPGRRVVPR